MAQFPHRLRRLPPPRLPQDRRRRVARPEPAPAAAAGSAGPATTPAAASRRPMRSSWSGWPAARPPSTCGTSSPTPRRASAASSSRSRPTRHGVADQRAPAEDGRRSWTSHHRPLAGPHHPVARPGHRVHDHRQQADRRASVSVARLAGHQAAARPKGVPPYVTFSELRSGTAGGRRLPRHRLQPVHRRGRPGGGKDGKARCNFRVRGIQLPTGFTLDELDNRDNCCCRASISGFEALDRAADLVDGLDAFHQQALDILRSDKTKNAFNLDQETGSRPRAATAARASARARWRPAGWSRRASASSPSASAAGTRTARTSTTSRTSCCRSSTRRCRP